MQSSFELAYSNFEYSNLSTTTLGFSLIYRLRYLFQFALSLTRSVASNARVYPVTAKESQSKVAGRF